MATLAPTHDTVEEYMRELEECRELFERKFKDYGASWRVMSPSSLTDQISIKAQRIRTLQTSGHVKRVQEGIASEFVGIVNYGIMALIQVEQGFTTELGQCGSKGNEQVMMSWYDAKATQALELMKAKNHDYGEAWRSMRLSSFADIILQKVFRTKQIEDNAGHTLVSEGIEANYLDMINYALFALIMIREYDEVQRMA